MKFAFASAAGLAALALASASAQDDVVSAGSVYARIGGGVSFVNDWRQDFDYNPDAAFAETPPTGQSIELGTGYAGVFALGFDYADGIRTELEYKYASAGVDAVVLDDPVNGPTAATPVNDDIVAHLLMANFYFDFANKSPLTPFIGGGVGGAFAENERAQRDAALALQGRAGVSLAMGGGFSTDLEYVYLRTNEFGFGPSVEDFEPAGPVGPAISGERLEASSVMVSVRKSF